MNLEEKKEPNNIIIGFSGGGRTFLGNSESLNLAINELNLLKKELIDLSHLETNIKVVNGFYMAINQVDKHLFGLTEHMEHL